MKRTFPFLRRKKAHSSNSTHLVSVSDRALKVRRADTPLMHQIAKAIPKITR